jgi:hypothetical protein
VTPGGDVIVQVKCPLHASGGCRGVVMLQLNEAHQRHARARSARCARGCRSLGSATYEAHAGQRVRVSVHMASLGRSLLARRRALPVTLTATSVSGTSTASSTVTLTLRARPGKR